MYKHPRVGYQEGEVRHRELEEVMGAEAGQEEAADVAVIVLAVHFRHVPVAVGPHEHVELLPDGVHPLSLSLCVSLYLGLGFPRGVLGSPSLRLPPQRTISGGRWGLL